MNFAEHMEEDMNIYGLQKFTLLDYPGHTACTVFLPGCNFDCPYCHNRGLAHNETKPVMSSKTFFEWLKTRVDKLDGVCISGGEPTLHPKIFTDLIPKIKAMGFLVKLDTNGYKPAWLLKAIYESKVDYVAMDVKSSYQKYGMTAGIEDISMGNIYSSVSIIMDSGIDYEFRTTVTKSMHDDSDFEEIGRLLKGAKRYFLQKCTTDTPDDNDMFLYRNIMLKYVENVGIRG